MRKGLKSDAVPSIFFMDGIADAKCTRSTSPTLATPPKVRETLRGEQWCPFTDRDRDCVTLGMISEMSVLWRVK